MSVPGDELTGVTSGGRTLRMVERGPEDNETSTEWEIEASDDAIAEEGTTGIAESVDGTATLAADESAEGEVGSVACVGIAAEDTESGGWAREERLSWAGAALAPGEPREGGEEARTPEGLAVPGLSGLRLEAMDALAPSRAIPGTVDMVCAAPNADLGPTYSLLAAGCL